MLMQDGGKPVQSSGSRVQSSSSQFNMELRLVNFGRFQLCSVYNTRRIGKFCLTESRQTQNFEF